MIREDAGRRPVGSNLPLGRCSPGGVHQHAVSIATIIRVRMFSKSLSLKMLSGNSHTNAAQTLLFGFRETSVVSLEPVQYP